MLANILVSALLPLGGAPNTNVFYTPDGALHVIGDAEVNDILMDSNGTPFIRVGFGQTLNGVPGPTSFVVEQEPARLFVSLGDGDDVLFVMEEPFGTNRVFDLGSGDDFLDIGNVGSGYASILAGDGDDWVHTEDCGYQGLFVDLGPGADNFEVMRCYIDRWFEAHAGSGPDQVRLRYAEFLGPVHVYGGTGVDSFMDIDSDYFDIAKFGEFESRSPGELGPEARWTPLDPMRKAERLVAGAVRLFHGGLSPMDRLPDAPPSLSGPATPR